MYANSFKSIFIAEKEDVNGVETMIINNLYILESSDAPSSFDLSDHSDEHKILCNHCLRTATNGIRCMGISVADNDY